MHITDSPTKEEIERGNAGDPGPLAVAIKRLAELGQAFLPIILICLFAPATIVLAQNVQPSAAAASQTNPLIAQNKMMYGVMKIWLLSSAEKMPEENYNFKPTEVVRSYGQILGHVADQHYGRCSLVRGEIDPNLRIEQVKTSKADLIAALKASFAYCDKAYDGIDDASANQMVKLGPQQFSKLGVLNINLLHSTLHYGNLITYMRLKNIVPPSSEAPYGPPPGK